MNSSVLIKLSQKTRSLECGFSLITNSSIIKSYGSVLEAPRRGDSNTDAQLMIIVTILYFLSNPRFLPIIFKCYIKY